MPVLCVERVQEATIENGRLTGELLEMARSHEHTRPIDTILYHPSFPVDVRHNTKIFREKLALWADKELVSRKRDSSPDSPPSDPPDEQGDEQR